MSVLHIVLSLALLLAIVAVVTFQWTARTRQSGGFASPEQRLQRADGASETLDSAVMARAAHDRRHRDNMASTHAETPHARSRASIGGG